MAVKIFFVDESGMCAFFVIKWLRRLRFGDPNHDPSLRGHVGCHPETTESQAGLVEMRRILVETKENVGMVV